MTKSGQSLVAEFLGTFALVLIGAGAIVTNQWTKGALGLAGIAAAHALILSIMISALGHISGGHFNPAVTFAVWIARRISTAMALLYWIAQLVGAVVASWLLLAIFPSAQWQPVHLGTPGLGFDIGFARGVLVEAILTFFLVIAVFGVAVDSRGSFKAVAGFGIGLVLGADILMGGPLTGAAMNPARAFGPALVSNSWQDHLVYWIGPLAGAAIAGAIYGYLLLARPSALQMGDPSEPGVRRAT
ncbi:MAG TPA: MIP family channel protein [Candidatus Limnocylindrales bacterium]|nr:MIP family channel protein [Candidatus Limnocylindrales bacterium]